LGQRSRCIHVNRGAHFDFAALEPAAQQGAQGGLLAAQFIGQAESEVQKAAVDCADFKPQTHILCRGTVLS